MSQKQKKILGLVTVVIFVLFSFTKTFQTFVNFPKEVRMFESTIKQINLHLPISATVSTSNSKVIKVNGQYDSLKIDLAQPIMVRSKREGKSILSLKLFGLIPFKSVSINVLKDIRVIPGGQTIGVKLKSAGIMVVGHHSIKQENGNSISPAERAGIHVGDLIIKIDGQKVKNVNDLIKKVNKYGKENKAMEIDLVRNKERIKVKVKPIYDSKADTYRLGLFIRDSAAGVGTLTFYDPVTNKYGALGHVITDVDTQKPIIVGEGKILYSNVMSIEKGESGKPGGKRAVFPDENNIIGDITKNTPFGIFGTMYQKPTNGLMNDPIPIALPEEVKKGPAEILTVIQGQKVERFKIEIVNVINQKYPATKGLVIKVTDPKLLKITGGIVQGMSGSPIIQNGKLVGAVTHVFVNDPTSGYGSFIEWMIRDAGLLNNNNLNTLKAS
ncbi:SpoIVB peptidase [Vulcanibacillus modesticaldus]|uniref:SpoIVB peptidase n=1 Tax=Vulcanibacillus modesticaldus TaxID=337097 RepID=A0A1D2YRT4_9BACI|nr:SpoIVB peptidase [Vulcanibacillus modesticaldus]OEF95529.1 SpoIVB peptidase [Vulcanibacillus modesticaldus]